MTEARYRTVLLALVLAGAALRVVGLNWDGGLGLHPDEGNLVRAALRLSFPDRLLPDFHAYNDLSLWLPRLVAWPLCAPDHHGCLTWAARLVSALMSVAAIPLAAFVARALAGSDAGPLAGLAAAAAMAGSAPLVQWAHFGTTESALVLLLLALWALSLAWLQGRVGERSFALGAAAALGLGFGFKTTALVFGLIPGVAVLLAGWPDRRRWAWLGAGAGLAVALALAAAPSVWGARVAWFDVMRFEGDVVAGRLAVFWTAQFHGTTPVLFELRQLASLTAGAGLALALAGLVLIPPEGRRLALPGLLLALVYAAVIMSWQARFVRYLAPLIPVLMVLAGVALGHLARGRWGRTARALGLAGLGATVLAGIDQAAIYLRPDPRLAARDALLAAAAPDDAVAIEPHDMARTGRLSRVVVPLSDRPLAPEALAAPLARAGWFVLASRRNWAVLPRLPDAPGPVCAFYTALADGSLGYVPVARFRRDGPFGRLFAPGLGAEETRTVFDRPEVQLFRNQARLAPQALAARLAQPADPAACAPAALARAWARMP